MILIEQSGLHEKPINTAAHDNIWSHDPRYITDE